MRAGFKELLLTGILISLMILSNPGYAEPGPSKINTSIYVYNIRSFDVTTGQYEIDFYLPFKWNPDENSLTVAVRNCLIPNLVKRLLTTTLLQE